MKIALGTVQWGMNYGIANNEGIPSNDVLKSIIYLAQNSGINLFDTAAQYGIAEYRIGNYLSKKSNIVTKIGSFSNGNSLKNQIENSLKNLKREKIYGCLIHNSKELINKDYLWDELTEFKLKGKLKKIGFSLYEPKELKILLGYDMIPDIIQVPYSVLDRKFEPYFELLKNKGVEIHVRSIYLQGLYFKNPDQLPNKFSKLKPVLKELQNISKKNKLNIAQFCLDFIRQNYNIDYAVIGVESENQLKEIIQLKNFKLNWDSILKSLDRYNIKEELLNPSNW